MNNILQILGKRLQLGIVVILVLIAVFTSIYKVDAGEQVAVLRFGELVEIVNVPGIKFKLPFGIDSTRAINVDQIHTIQYGYRVTEGGSEDKPPSYVDQTSERIMLTYGGYLVETEVVLQYKISNVEKYLFRIDDPIGTLRLALESVLRRNVQNKTLDNALVEKDTIQQEVLPELREKVSQYDMGIRITSLEIQNISVPAAVSEAYSDVNNAKNEMAELMDKATKYYNEKIPGARASAYERIKAAEGYKTQKVSLAKGDAERFSTILKEYSQAKDITQKRLYLEMMEEVLSKVKNKYIIDADDNSGVIKLLPIGTQNSQNSQNTQNTQN